MTDKAKKWQAKIWIGENFSEPVVIYAETLTKMRLTAMTWLQENKPVKFSNLSPDIERESVQTGYYAQASGSRKPKFPVPVHWSIFKRTEPKSDSEWYYVTLGWGYPKVFDTFENAVDHFVKHTLIIDKGPDYQETLFVAGDIKLHLIKKTQRESDEYVINQMIQRGWCILGTEIELDEEYQYEISRKVIFVLGHVEEDAT